MPRELLTSIAYVMLFSIMPALFAPDWIHAACATAAHLGAAVFAHCAFLTRHLIATAYEHLWIVATCLFLALLCFDRIIIRVWHTTHVFEMDANVQTVHGREIAGKRSPGQSLCLTVSPSGNGIAKPKHVPRRYIDRQERVDRAPSVQQALANRMMTPGSRQFTTPLQATALARYEQFATPENVISFLSTPTTIEPRMIAEQAPTTYETLKQMGMVNQDGTPTKKWTQFEQQRRERRDTPRYPRYRPSASYDDIATISGMRRFQVYREEDEVETGDEIGESERSE
jgi:hypothetical protein